VTVPLKAGDAVYRVIEIDPPDDTPYTWKVACVTVAKASDRQVRLKTNFSGLSRRLFKPDALGRVFFESPLQAIQFFVAERRHEIESLDRRKKDAERALAWAASQRGMR
jgi:hypothetical protein